MKQHRFFISSLFSLLAILLFVFICNKNPWIATHIYKNGIFAFIRVSYDTLIGQWLPFPFVIIALLFVFGGLFYFMAKRKKSLPKLSFGIGWILYVITAFYLFWGINYSVPSVSKLIDLKYEKVDSTALYAEMEHVMEKINSFRLTHQNDTLPLNYQTENLEKEVRGNLKATFDQLGIYTTGHPRVRTLKPKGILMRWKTAGIYVPHAFEGHIDGGLLDIEHPFTMAHEMSHAYGIAGEGDCNFTAFLACASSDNPYFQYSAYIDYSLYLLRDVYRTNKKKHAEFYRKLHPGFRADLKSMVENGKKYPDIFPKIRDMMYDNYLKAQGIQDGIKNYSRIIQMVINYRAQHPEFLG